MAAPRSSANSQSHAGGGPRLAPGAPGASPQPLLQLPPKARLYLPSGLHYLLSRILAAASRLSFSTDVRENLDRFRAWSPSKTERFKYGFLLFIALFSLYRHGEPRVPLQAHHPGALHRHAAPARHFAVLLAAAPIFAWLILFYSCKFIPARSVRTSGCRCCLRSKRSGMVPTSRTFSPSSVTPILDILAWIPYGIVHFAAPFFVAAFLFVFAPPTAVKVFAQAFGFMMLTGVIIQILFPCAPPWYELREGLIPANYGMRGSPAGLARISTNSSLARLHLTFTGAPCRLRRVPFAPRGQRHHPRALLLLLLPTRHQDRPPSPRRSVYSTTALYLLALLVHHESVASLFGRLGGRVRASLRSILLLSHR